MNRNCTHRFTRLWIFACLLATCIAAIPASAHVDIVEVGHVQDIYGYGIGDGSSAKRIAVLGHFLFVGNDESGLRIYDISDPAKPAFVSAITNGYEVSDFAFSGQYAYLANDYQGFPIYDVSDPLQPVNLSRTRLWSVIGVSVSGHHAYTVGDSTLSILDITNAAAPIILSQTYVPFPAGITVSGEYAFVMTYSDGTYVFDISRPIQPIQLGRINPVGTREGGHSMAIQGHYAYMANGWDGLHIYDLSNPARPASVSQIKTLTFAQKIVLNGNLAWIVDSYYGLRLYNISNPLHPIPLAAAITNHGSSSFDVAFTSDYAYLANGWDGIRIYKYTLPTIPPPPVKQRPPANDNFLAATPILTQHAFITATNTLATREPLEPPIAGDTSGHSLWWTWNSISPRSTVINISQSEHRFPMSVYGFIPGKGFTKVAEGYDYLIFNTRLNSRYWLVIGSDRGVTGTIKLFFDQYPL